MSKIPYKRMFPYTHDYYPQIPQIKSAPLIPQYLPQYVPQYVHQFPIPSQTNQFSDLPQIKQMPEIYCDDCGELFSHLIGYPITPYSIRRIKCIKCSYSDVYHSANDIGVTAGYNAGYLKGKNKIIYRGDYTTIISNSKLKSLGRKLLSRKFKKLEISEDIKLATKTGFKDGVRYGYSTAVSNANSVYEWNATHEYTITYERSNYFNCGIEVNYQMT